MTGQGWFLGMCDGCYISVYSNDRRGVKLIYDLRDFPESDFRIYHGNCHPLPPGPITQGINRRKRLAQLRA